MKHLKMNKFLLIIPLLILNSPIKEKANRFSDILITPINQENVISFSYLTYRISEVNLNIFISYDNHVTRDLYRNKPTINYNFKDSFIVKEEQIFDNAYLNFQAKGDSFSSFIKIELVTHQTLDLCETLSISNDTAIQYLNNMEQTNAEREELVFEPLLESIKENMPFLQYNFIKFKQITNYYSESISYKSITIKLHDTDNYFPLLNHKNGYVDFHFEPLKVKDTYQLALLDKLYLDPDSFLISSTPKQGFVFTDIIYLPKNCNYRYLDLSLNINGLGYQNVDVTCKYQQIATKNFFGRSEISSNYLSLLPTDDVIDSDAIEVIL